MSFTLDLIEIALRDIRASKVLFKEKLYAQSYFSFQQASEKATKAYGLFSEIISENELKKDIQHNQLKIFRKAIVKEEKEIKSSLETLNSRPNVAKHQYFNRENIDKHLKNLENGLKFHDGAKQLNLLTYKKEELLYYIEGMDEIYRLRIKFVKKEKQKILNEIKELIQFGSSFVSPQYIEELQEVLKEENQKEYFEILEGYLNQYYRAIFIHYTFYFCALITIRHSNLSRYPDGGENPTTFYNLKNQSVKYQEDFLYYLERALKIFRKIASHTAKN
jgi:HEPN domain-containing protein